MGNSWASLFRVAFCASSHGCRLLSVWTELFHDVVELTIARMVWFCFSLSKAGEVVTGRLKFTITWLVCNSCSQGVLASAFWEMNWFLKQEFDVILFFVCGSVDFDSLSCILCLDYLRDCPEPSDSNCVNFLEQRYKRRPEPHLKSTTTSRFRVRVQFMMHWVSWEEGNSFWLGYVGAFQTGGWVTGLEDKVWMDKEIIVIVRGKMVKTVIQVSRLSQLSNS